MTHLERLARIRELHVVMIISFLLAILFGMTGRVDAAHFTASLGAVTGLTSGVLTLYGLMQFYK